MSGSNFIIPVRRLSTYYGWTLSGANSSNLNSNINLTGTITPGGFFLILDNDNMFQYLNGFAPNYLIRGLSLSNKGQTLKLIDPTSAVIDTADYWGGAWPAGIDHHHQIVI